MHGRPQQRRNMPKAIDSRLFVNKAQELVKEEQAAPTHSFADFGFDAAIQRNIERKGYTTPTPIQDQSIPHVMAGKDVIGLANTGTGKTAAFSLPSLHKMIREHGRVKTLIMAPTRELAMQIRDEIRAFTQGMPIYSALCIGGTSMNNQIYEVKRIPHIIIGTPGRLKDLVERRVLDLSKFSIVVLDEVDRMLDMGFIKDITYLISLTPKERQTLFFSATMTSEIEQLTSKFLTDPVKISVVQRQTAAHVEQNVIKVKDKFHKESLLAELLVKDEYRKVIIFGRTKWGVEKLSRNLFKKGFKVGSIHGDKPQSKRQNVLRMFRENVINVLVATDVAARGLDIADITHVINYDQPATYEDYIHRIGRTGRANNKGNAVTFVEG